MTLPITKLTPEFEMDVHFGVIEFIHHISYDIVIYILQTIYCVIFIVFA